jgi:hypothetical protein
MLLNNFVATKYIFLLFRYKSLDVKNILMESMLHHILPQMLVSPLWIELNSLLKDYLKFMDDHFRESADLTFLAYHHKNYSKVCITWVFIISRNYPFELDYIYVVCKPVFFKGFLHAYSMLDNQCLVIIFLSKEISIRLHCPPLPKKLT